MSTDPFATQTLDLASMVAFLEPKRPVGRYFLPRVYRAYAEDGALLYVGCTVDLLPRMRSHQRHAEWWHLVHHFVITGYPSKHEALRVERRAINTEGPAYNRHRRRHAVRSRPQEAALRKLITEEFGEDPVIYCQRRRRETLYPYDAIASEIEKKLSWRAKRANLGNLLCEWVLAAEDDFEVTPSP